MDNPARLLRRAKQHQHRIAVPPAPAAEVQTAAKTPVHTSSHANYSALMRSHDRMASRHIAPRNGA